MLPLHENASVHKSHIALADLHDYGFQTLNDPPDLATSDFYLFPNIKKHIRGKKFMDDKEIKGRISAYFVD